MTFGFSSDNLPEMKLKEINQLIRNRHNISDCCDISEGWCYFWSLEFYKRYGGELCVVRNTHAFNKLNGIYYDSETHNGVIDWRKLHYFKLFFMGTSFAIEPENMRCEIMSLEQFKEHWGVLF